MFEGLWILDLGLNCTSSAFDWDVGLGCYPPHTG